MIDVEALSQQVQPEIHDVLIYTSEGYVPQSELEYHKNWTINDQMIKFEEVWLREGRLVKNNVHIYAKDGIAMTGEQFTG